MAGRSTFETEQKILYGLTGCTVFGILLLMISLATDYWVIMEIPGGVWRNSTQSYVTQHHSGLWRICRTELHNKTQPHIQRDYCAMLKLFPSVAEVKADPEVDLTILNYSRTETAFMVIALILMCIGHVFVFYSLREPRYMFKRLAAFLHIMTAVCILVGTEVLISSVNYEQKFLVARHPKGAYYTYGFCFYFAWIVFAFYVIAAIAFLICSRKRKGARAGSQKAAFENEPVHLGRV